MLTRPYVQAILNLLCGTYHIGFPYFSTFTIGHASRAIHEPVRADCFQSL